MRKETLTPEFYDYLHQLEKEKGSVKFYRKKSKELRRLRQFANIKGTAEPGARGGGARNTYHVEMDVLEQLRKETNLNAVEFSTEIGMNATWFANVKRKKTMGKKAIEALENYFGIDRSEFLKD